MGGLSILIKRENHMCCHTPVTSALKRQGQEDRPWKSRHSLICIVSCRQGLGDLCDNGGRNWNNADTGRGSSDFCMRIQESAREDSPLEPPEGSGPCQHAAFGHTALRAMTTTICCLQPWFRTFCFYSLEKQINSRPSLSSVWVIT